MNAEKWIIAYGKYEGLEKRAVELLCARMQPYLKKIIVVKRAETLTEEEKKSAYLAVVGTVTSNPMIAALQKAGAIEVGEGREGYAIKVGQSPFSPEYKAIVVAAKEEAGVLYGTVDLLGVYFDKTAFAKEYDVRDERYFPSAFGSQMSEFSAKSAPAVRERAVWTWGHCIYDFERFFQNMALLKLNQAVIWNDFSPVNAKEIVECARSWGIEIFWGFAWGWDTAMPSGKEALEKVLAQTDSVVEKYEREYASLSAAGIYFQSFTETGEEQIGGKYIAEAVTDYVNEISSKLFARYPDLKLQFGLHASSVKTRLFALQKVDPRIRIVWEDCGSTPYAYLPERTQTFDETLRLSERMATLRGTEDKFGAVYKGMPTLDWAHFEHIEGPFVLGKSHAQFTKRRDKDRRALWKFYQSFWLVNYPFAQRTTELLARLKQGDLSLQLLIEDGMFEEKIFFPAALLAEILWNPYRDGGEIVQAVADCPWVEFANL